MLSDEEILKQVCEEMNIAWNDTPGYMMIEGVLARDYLKNHDIFEEEICCQQALFNETEINNEFIFDEFFEECDDLLIAA